MYLNSGKRALRRGIVTGGIILLPLLAAADDRPKDEQKPSSAASKADGESQAANKADSPEVFEPGGTVRPPKLIHYVEPEFSGSSKGAFVEGVVKISTIVTPEGTASLCRVVSGLNTEEDHTAVEALKQWRFRPGTKDGKPVHVRVTVEVAFHLL